MVVAPSGELTYVNQAWEDQFGKGSGRGLDWQSFIHPHDLDRCWTEFERASRDGDLFRVEYRMRGKEGDYRWYLGHARSMRDEDGKILQWYATCIDIDEQKRTVEQERLLGEFGAILGSSLDIELTLARLVGLCVPDFADWAIIDILDEKNNPRRVEVAYRDPHDRELAARVKNTVPIGDRAEHPPSAALFFGKTVLIEDRASERLAAHSSSSAHLKTIEEVDPIALITVPLISEGKTAGALSLMTDARSKRRYRQADLNWARELARHASNALENATLFRRAQEAIRARDEFLSIASHELKTPLTTMKLQTQVTRRILETEGPAVAFEPEKMKRFLEHTHRSIDRVSRLVDDMLDVSRIATGKLTLHPEAANLGQIAREVLDRLGPVFAQTKCRIVTRIEDLVHGNWDAFRIEQVITNLLTNAARYGDGSDIEIDVKKTESFAIITVRDYGRGIAPDDQERIFQRFERAAVSSGISGMGLGLFIVREIVQMHGGTIQVESALGEGARFTISLPTSVTR
jgi:PAS domain S-box-containing protein